MNIRTVILSILVATASGTPAWAQQQASGAAPDGQASASTAAVAWTHGEVRKVDAEQGRVTIKHGPIANLGMPGMTMVFKAADPKLLIGLKEGDKVRFVADKAGSALTVAAMEPDR